MAEESWTFYGDWDQLHIWLKNKSNPKVVLENLVEPMEKLGKAIKGRAIWRLKTADASWQKLAESTVRKKGHDRFYLETGNYIDSIQNETIVGSNYILVKVGPPEDLVGGKDYQYIGRVLEFGSTTIPARPVWRPLMNKVQKLAAYRKLLEALAEDF